MEIKLFERIERTFKNKIVFAKLTDKSDNVITLQPFEIQPIEVDYDIEGIEHIKEKGDILSAVRFTPTDTGKYTLEIMLDNEQTVTESFDVVDDPHTDHAQGKVLKAKAGAAYGIFIDNVTLQAGHTYTLKCKYYVAEKATHGGKSYAPMA